MYQPKNNDFRDFDLIPFEGKLFVIYITGTDTKDCNQFALASSTDGVHWREEDIVMTVRPSSWDSKSLWAMHVTREGNEFVLYYSALGDESRRHQSMGIARSKNLREWIREEKPLLYLESDNPYYSDDIDQTDRWFPNEPTILFRDPWSLRYQERSYVIFAARDKNLPHDNNACVGLAEILPDNTVKYLPPIFSPSKYHVLECPALYLLDGKWILLFCDDDIDVMRYAVSGDPFRGYSEPDSSPLLSSENYVGRLTEWGGKFLFYYHTPDHHMSDPKNILFSEGKLLLSDVS